MMGVLRTCTACGDSKIIKRGHPAATSLCRPCWIAAAKKKNSTAGNVGFLRTSYRWHPLYNIWKGMNQRCLSKTHKDFKNYGARGIDVAGVWRRGNGAKQAFLNFVAYVGPRPDGHSLDRIDNNGNYEPGNVRWADAAVQRKNQRASRRHKFVTCPHCNFVF